MADGPQGLAHWPGVKEVIDADMTFSHGITPSVCTMRIPAGSGGTPAEYGTLTFTFGGTTISFPDCKMVTTSINVTPQGQLQTLTIYDRRWKWIWGNLSGIWNTRLADGTIIDNRKRTPRQLGAMCLGSLGEIGYDVTGLGTQARPEVNWDRDTPAHALNDLADFFGCRVVLRLNNRVMVMHKGIGANLPDGHFTEDAVVFDPPEKPRELIFSAGPNRYQHDFGLIPVGRDLDLKIKPIDQLSYRPKIGWEREATPDFPNVLKEFGHAAWQWAKRTVWRWYRIWGNKDYSQPINIPPYGPLADGWQIVPIENEQVHTWKDNGIQIAGPAGNTEKDVKDRLAGWLPTNDNVQAQVFGTHRNGRLDYFNTRWNDLYMGAFSIERDEGVVMFHDHVFRKEGAIKKPAFLYLRTACSIRHADTRAWVRYEKRRTIGDVPTPPRILKHDEVVLSHITAPINLPECEQDAIHYLDAAELEYQQLQPQTRTYAGLIPIDLDGAIQQVQWHVGQPYAWTKASRNNEASLVVPGYEQRRKDQKLRKSWLDEQEAQAKWTRHIKMNRNPFEPLR